MTVEPIQIAHSMVEILDQRKGEDILLLDIAEICSFTDLFVLCSGGSERTLRALSDEVQMAVKDSYQLRPNQIEGDSSSGWVLLDYGGVVLHLFSPTLREYYALEELWGEGQVVLRIA